MTKALITAAAVCLLALALLAQAPAGAQDTPDTKAPAHPNVLTENPAGWTGTTKEAATTDAQKEWLNRGKPQTITGEVVDVSCYLQLGKTGEKHMDCGSKCVRNGQPIGLLTSDKKLYIVMPEEHHPRRDGQVSIREAFASRMGKTVTVNGMVQDTPQGKAVFVSAAEVNKSAS